MDIFSPADYAAARKPLEEASTLPPHVYTSPDWYGREVEAIFQHSWLIAARAEEIPKRGDYKRVHFFDRPLIVVRGSDGVVRTLSGSCRHRGAELVKGDGNCRAFVCPYHSWAYSLTGQLVAAPQMEGVRGFSVSDERLPSIRTEVWGGFVCINFDPEAPSLVESLGKFADRFESYRLDEMRVVRKWDFRVNCNWKIWAENSRENFHLMTVHRASFARFRPEGFRFEPFKARIEPGKFSINSGPIDHALSFSTDEAPVFPKLEGLSDEDRGQAHYAFCYPHFILNLYPDKLVYHQLFPEGPDWTRLVYVACFPEATVERAGFKAAVEQNYYPAAEMALDEDRAICETEQRGLRNPLAAPGRLSAIEEATVHAFDNYVLDRVLERRNRP